MAVDRRHTRLTVPSVLDQPVIVEARDAHRRLVELLGESARTIRELKLTREQAVKEDRRAYAQALAAGRKDPGQKHTEKADADVAAEVRKMDALELAVADAAAAVMDAVEEHRGEIAEQIALRLADAAEQYGTAVEGMALAHGELSSALGLRAWLRRFPDPAKASTAQLGTVPALVGRNGDPMSFSTVLEAVRGLGDLDRLGSGDSGSFVGGTRIADPDEEDPVADAKAHWQKVRS